MNYDHILVRYAELSLKGKNRSQFEKRLQHNVRTALKDSFPDVQVKRSFGRMFIRLNGHDEQGVSDVLRGVFGIHSFSPALKTGNDLEQIKKAGLYAMKDAMPNEQGTFKVSAKRIDKTFSVKSQQLNYELGSYILTNTDEITVDVHKPDVELRVEVRQDATYLTCRTEYGPGGLPTGTGGKVMLMLSGGIDSPVAGFQMFKRGVEMEAVHFHSPPFTNERALQKVKDLTKVLSRHAGAEIKLHVVPFTEAQKKIHEAVPGEYEMTIMRRVMLRIAEKVAYRRKALALVNGESLGQVASQTLDSMNTINEVTNIPILRPLVAMDKQEVVEIAEKIDTYELSILPYEDCCTIFLPPQTKTKPNREKAARFEAPLEIDAIVDDAVERTEVHQLSSSEELDKEFEDLF
ncbi:tRNA uracil 4-sulfurtransferase ThiI [Alteribacter natronophilus]|uniref:tRNA uracil 4-sulfurtransferase ThiI n=1 Tax=Alteribacter natronophilus TaxID=2583810 RepID=UPI00110F56BB|nr:tRNA uracil 4-sulfurtransferase ThiI [Alteribacter natronophilus]TMW71899.1 tRNA 4-thiouridine(8) synthase ThiI [Alteribacter natronophilus]